MLFLWYPKCTTCQKAKKWLKERNPEFSERHIVEDRPSNEVLREWYEKSGLPLKRFFNTSGNKYKELHLKDKLPSDVNPLARLMLRSDFSWNSVSVLLKSLTPELSDFPLERLRTARA